jgi:hypothetical protein
MKEKALRYDETCARDMSPLNLSCDKGESCDKHQKFQLISMWIEKKTSYPYGLLNSKN